jgi:hypothetical protein
MKKHSLTRKIKKELANLALMLPKVPAHPAPEKAVLGSAILSENPNAKLKDGSSIKPDVKYQQFTVASANHFRRLCRAYESGGEQAVNTYVQPFRPVSENGSH